MVTYGGELLHLRIWHGHSLRSAHSIVATCVSVCMKSPTSWIKMNRLSSMSRNTGTYSHVFNLGVIVLHTCFFIKYYPFYILTYESQKV